MRTQLSAHARAWLVWAVIVGVTAGIPLATLAGARRTQTAYARFLDATEAYDVLVANGGTSPTNLNRQFDLESVAALPEVEAAGAVLGYYGPYGVRADGLPIDGNDLLPLALLDERFGRDFNALPMVRGRMPDTATEIALSPLAADNLEAGIGDTLMMDLVPYPEAATDSIEDHRRPTGRFAVVGIVAVQGGFPPVNGGARPRPSSTGRSPKRTRATPNCSSSGSCRRLRRRRSWTGFRSSGHRTRSSPRRRPSRRSRSSGVWTSRRPLSGSSPCWSWSSRSSWCSRRCAAAWLTTRPTIPSGRRSASRPGELRRSRMAIGALTTDRGGDRRPHAVALSPLFPVGVGRDLEVDSRACGPTALPDPRGARRAAHRGRAPRVATAGQARADVVARRPRRPARLAPLLASSTVPTTAAMGMSMAVETGRGPARCRCGRRS